MRFEHVRYTLTASGLVRWIPQGAALHANVPAMIPRTVSVRAHARDTRATRQCCRRIRDFSGLLFTTMYVLYSKYATKAIMHTAPFVLGSRIVPSKEYPASPGVRLLYYWRKANRPMQSGPLPRKSNIFVCYMIGGRL